MFSIVLLVDFAVLYIFMLMFCVGDYARAGLGFVTGYGYKIF